MMESGEIKLRFGRCPSCRTMIYQNPEAVIFFCSKCRTPIRGKNHVPTEEIDQALSMLEILSVDTSSVFSEELDVCHNKLAPGVDIDGDHPPFFHQDNASPRSSSPAPDGFGSVRRRHSLTNGAPTSSRFDDGFVDSNDQERLQPFSRRTRRSSSGSDSDSSVRRYGMLVASDSETEDGFSSPRNARERRRRRSLLGSQAFVTSIGLSGQEPHGIAPPSPLKDPAFNGELVNALDNLRGLIAAIEPASSSWRAPAPPPRDAHGHLFRRLDSQLARALHIDGRGRGHHRNASSTGSSSSSSSSGGYRSERRTSLCRPVLGGAPFLVCRSCSELLQAPPATAGLLPRGKQVARLRCGGCEEVLEMTTAVTAGAGGGSAPHETARAGPGRCNSGAPPVPPQPLHRALGYSSPSPLLLSRRY